MEPDWSKELFPGHNLIQLLPNQLKNLILVVIMLPLLQSGDTDI